MVVLGKGVLLVILLLCVSSAHSNVQGQERDPEIDQQDHISSTPKTPEVCDAGTSGGVCLNDHRIQCGHPNSWCDPDSLAVDSSSKNKKKKNKKKKKISLYRHGGTAQAYIPDVPLSSVVCDPEIYRNHSSSSRYRVAWWPLSRSSPLKAPPQVTLQISLWSCSSSISSSDGSAPSCCCQPLISEGTTEPNVDDDQSSSAAMVEVWQARPDGSYSSLRETKDLIYQIKTTKNQKKRQTADCRARVAVEKGKSQATLTTVAPGSTGIMGGLGPSRVDFPPFGPPLLHMFVSAPGHAPLLMDLPFLLNRKTLQQRSNIFGGDWRGSAWMRHKNYYYSKDKPYDISKWAVVVDRDNHHFHLEIDINVYLSREQEMDDSGGVSSSLEAQSLWCPSGMMYGLPSSFFLEPIGVCVSSLLDFFAL